MRKLAIGLLSLLLLLGQGAAPALALAAPSVVVSPTSGPRGTAIGVSAAGLAPDAAHLVQVVRGVGNVNTVRVFEEPARSDARGELHYRLAMNQEPGAYTVRIVAVGGTVLATAPFTVTPGGPPAGERFFPETGYAARGRFLGYWAAHGLDLGDAGISYRESLALFGYPISGELEQRLEDGRTYTVQYFERARMEFHPEFEGTPHEVLLGQFGRRILAEEYVVDRRAYDGAVAPAAPVAGARYFPETGHNLGGRFLAYWEANGGLAQFGLPLTEERSDGFDGKTYTTQYFERARFEYHPEHAGTPYEVLLGQFGRRIMGENALLGGEFARRFLTDQQVQVNLGSPVSAAIASNGATQPFERGRMFYAADAPPLGLVRGGYLDRNAQPPSAIAGAASALQAVTEPTIYALCGGADRGDIFTNLAEFTYFFRDTWDGSQPQGGGPGPRPGLHEPKRGFGKVWRDRQAGSERAGVNVAGARSCLGYATSPDETASTIAVQYFQGGAMLLADTPEGRSLYVLTVGYYSNGGGPSGTYVRYPVR